MMKKKSRITIRPARTEDIKDCLQLDHRLDTEYVWQMQRREENERTQISFQTLRLPRPICVEYPRSTESLRIDLEPLGGVVVAESLTIILPYTHFSLPNS